MLALLPVPAAPIIGQAVPDAAVVSMAGETVRVSQFKGKKLVVFSWASW